MLFLLDINPLCQIQAGSHTLLFLIGKFIGQLDMWDSLAISAVDVVSQVTCYDHQF